MWSALFVFAVGSYTLFGREDRGVRTADMTTPQLHTGIVTECGLFRRTCLVNGDTGRQDGIKWRTHAIDAPEPDTKAGCGAEQEKAKASLARLKALMADGYTIKPSVQNDRFGRALVDVVLRDGPDAGFVRITEGLAHPWPNTGNVWCGR